MIMHEFLVGQLTLNVIMHEFPPGAFICRDANGDHALNNARMITNRIPPRQAACQGIRA
ncbi:hypothetical protein ABH927_001988 [Planotetraspora sp. GP83]